MSDQNTVLRGKEAQLILDSTVFRGIVEGIESEAVESLVACSMRPDAKDERDALVWHLKMVRKQRAMLMGMVEQGKFAQNKLDKLNEKPEPLVRQFMRRAVNG